MNAAAVMGPMPGVVRRPTRSSRARKTTAAARAASLLICTKRMVGRCDALHIAPASDASLFCRFTKGFRHRGANPARETRCLAVGKGLITADLSDDGLDRNPSKPGQYQCRRGGIHPVTIETARRGPKKAAAKILGPRVPSTVSPRIQHLECLDSSSYR